MYRNHIARFMKRSLNWFLGCLYKRKDEVLFESFGGKQYSDNPKAISEKLHEMYPHIGIMWLLQEGGRYENIVPSYVKRITPKSFEHLKALVSAKCFVSNDAGIHYDVYKRNDQYYVSTWHGDRGFKRVIFDIKDNPLRRMSDVRYQITDLFLVASDYGKNRSKDSFLYGGEFLCEGMPRNDILVTQPKEKIKKIKASLAIDEDSKILLFAPTFRHSKEKQKVEVDLEAVLTKLKEKGEKWTCLIRSHSSSAGLDINDCGQFIDASNYPDMADLLLISDMLITDYSSSSGDFILRNKPVVLVHFDAEDYQTTNRELRFSPKDAGYFCVYDNEELLQLIENMTDEMAIAECEKLKKFFGIHETGKSAEIVCQRIAEFIAKGRNLK